MPIPLDELEGLADAFRLDRARRKTTPRAAQARAELAKAAQALRAAADAVSELDREGGRWWCLEPLPEARLDPTTGLIEIKAAGLGFTIIRRRVFQRLARIIHRAWADTDQRG